MACARPATYQQTRSTSAAGTARSSGWRSPTAALFVWQGSHLDPHPVPRQAPVAVPLNAGDAVVMHPKLAHAGSLNLGHTVRTMVYFRLLGGS